MHPKLKARLQQLNFYIGRNPKVKRYTDFRFFVPEPYKSVIIFSADFELAWAWRYTKRSSEPLQKALAKATLERQNIPVILSLCENFNIPITWLTVGHLFLDKCSRVNGKAHPELPRLTQFENNYWRFSGNDWFEYDPCTDFISDPLWYCPDLIEQILKSKIEHEIGCHTFSHIDCRDEVCSPDHFSAEIDAWYKAASRFGITKAESFVHPGHTVGNLDMLKHKGFTSFRTDNSNILGYPKQHANGLWEFSTTLELDYYPAWSEYAQINRYITLFKRAIRYNSVAYTWFHPSFDPRFALKIMPPIFDWLNENREKIWIVSIGDYVRWLNSRS